MKGTGKKTQTIHLMRWMAVLFALVWAVIWCGLLMYTASATTEGEITIDTENADFDEGDEMLTFSAECLYNYTAIESDDSTDTFSEGTGCGTVTVEGSNDGTGSIVLTSTDAVITTQTGCVGDYTYAYAYCVTTVTLTIKNSSDSGVILTYESEVSSETASGEGEAGEGSLDIGGSSASSGTLIIESGASATITLYSRGSNNTSAGNAADYTITTGTITITGMSYASESYITFNSSDKADYTVTDSTGNTTEDGTIAFDTVITDTEDNTYTLTLDEADIPEGYCFAGWINGSTGELLSGETTYEGVRGGSSTSYSISLCLVPDDAAMYYIESEGTDTMYYCLDSAILAAGSRGTIVMYRDEDSSAYTYGTVYGSLGQTEFTIPSGVTLLLPYSQDDLEVGEGTEEGTSEDNSSVYTCEGFGAYDNAILTSSYSSSSAMYPEKNNVLNLTILEGTTINVSGSLVIGGTLQANTNVPSGATSGAHANLYLNGSLVVKNGGVVSSCGYILGSGSISCLDGSTLYEPMVILDFRGGSFSMYALSNDVMPFTQYSLQNVQTSIAMEEGAFLYAYTDLYLSSSTAYMVSTIRFVGDSNHEAVIELSEGATLSMEYDAETAVDAYPQVGRTSISIRGGAEYGTFELEIFPLFATLDTADIMFTIPYNFDVTLGGSGVYTLSEQVALLPGATLTVEEGSVLTVTGSDAALAVFDGADDYTETGTTLESVESHEADSDNDHYPTAVQLQNAGLSRCGELIVNGTLNIGTDGTTATFAGLVQTTGSYDTESASGPVINTGENAVLESTVQLGLATSDYAGATTYDLTAVLVSLGDSEETGTDGESQTVEAAMVAGGTYYGVSGNYTDEDFSYKLYTSSSAYTEYGAVEDTESGVAYSKFAATEQAISGAWYSYAAEIYAVAVLSGTVSEEPVETMYFLSGETMAELLEGDYASSGLYVDSALSTGVESTDTIDSLASEGSATVLLYTLDTDAQEIALRYNGNGGTCTDSDGTTGVTQYIQILSLSDTGAEVTLEENAFSYTDNSDMAFAGWALDAEATEAVLTDGWTGTVAELISALEAADATLDIDSGTTVDLYAVWVNKGEQYITFNSSDEAEYTVIDSQGNSTENGTLSFDTLYVNTYDSGVTYTLILEEEDVPEGYVFAGWMEGTTYELLSSDSTWTEVTGSTVESYSIQPCFAPDDSALYYIESEGMDIMYYFLDQAITAAGEDGTIVVYRDEDSESYTYGTVYGSLDQTEFTIPENVTLLLPYDQEDLEIGDSSGFAEQDNSVLTSSTSDDKALEPEVQNVLNLTVPEGTTLNVSGSLVIGGTIQANANATSGATAGDHANLYLNGSLVVNEGGLVSVCGYILGEGSVTSLEGSCIYQPFVVMDFLGGTYTMDAAGNATAAAAFGMGVGNVSGETDKDYVMPFIRYTVQNVQTTVKMSSGAYMYGYAVLYVNSSFNTTTAVLVGNAEKQGLITLEEEASITMEYDADEHMDCYEQVGRTCIDISGGASLGALDLVITYLGIETTVDTSSFIFDLPYNYEVTLGGEGTYTIGHSFAILPGASLTVEEGSTLNITGDETDFLIYDGLDDYTCTSSSTSYDSDHAASYDNDDYPTATQLQEDGFSRCGEFIVNGTLNIGTDGTTATFAGLVQTTGTYDAETGSGPVIHVGEEVDLDYTAQIGVAGSSSDTLTDGGLAGATTYALTAMLVSLGDSEETGTDGESQTVEAAMVAGGTYYGVSGTYTDEDFSYTLYTGYDSDESAFEYTVYGAEQDEDNGIEYSTFADTEESISGAWYSYAAEIYAVAVLSGTVSEEPVETMYFLSGETMAELLEGDYAGSGLYVDSALSTGVASTDTIDSLATEGTILVLLYTLDTDAQEIALRYNGNGGSYTDSDGTTEVVQYTQILSLSDTTAEVVLEENLFELEDTGMAFAGWALSSDSTIAELKNAWTGTVAELLSALEEADPELEITSGTTIDLYAVWTDISDKYVTFLASELAEYTVTDTDGNSTEDGTISFDTAYKNAYDSGIVYTVTVDEDEIPDGYYFAGWIEGTTGELLGTDSTYSTMGSSSEDFSIQLSLVKSDTAMYYIESEGTDIMYYFLDHAITAAGEDGTIVMYGNDSNTEGTVYGSLGQTEFTIPENVTLLLPYDQDDLVVMTEEDDVDASDVSYYLPYANAAFTSSGSDGTNTLYPEKKNVLNLTIPEGTTIHVSGRLVIGGTLQANANISSGATNGAHANLYLEGELVINDGGLVSVCGYILGDGTVTCLAGSSLYEPVVVMDFLGGSYTIFTSAKTDEDNPRDPLSPFIRYAIENVQTPVSLVQGAYLYGYSDIYYSSTHSLYSGVLVGDSTLNGLITLAEGASLYATYDPDKNIEAYSQIGRTSITISGGAEYVPTYDFESVLIDISTNIFTIPYNFDITLTGNGTYTIGASLAILPGATLTVEEGSTLNLVTDHDLTGTKYEMVFLVYDGLDDYTCTSSGAAYSSTHAASYSNDDYPTAIQLQEEGFSRCGEFIVNGTLNIGSEDTNVVFAGLVQTTGTYDAETGTGPVIQVASTVDLDYTAQIGGATSSYSGGTTYELTALLVSRGDSSETGTDEDGNTVADTVETAMAAGMTYYGISGTYTDEDFSYTLYYADIEYGSEADDDSGIVYSVFADTEQTVYGAWYNRTAEVYTVGSLSGSVSSESVETLYFLSGDTFEDLLADEYSSSGLYTDSTLATAVSATDTIDSIIAAEIESGTVASDSLMAILYTGASEFILQYNGSGGTYAESDTAAAVSQYIQYISMYDTSETVTLDANLFTYGEYSFEGWGTYENTAVPVLKDQWSGTAAELISTLGAAGLTVSSGGTVNLYAVWTTDDVISVTIEWDSLFYTYGDGYQYVWTSDGETLKYELQDGSGNAVDDSWESSSNTITITNDSSSTAAVSASLAFTESTDLSFALVMGFAVEDSSVSLTGNEDSTASISGISAGKSVAVTADLSGMPTGSGENTTLGTITITIWKTEQ